MLLPTQDEALIDELCLPITDAHIPGILPGYYISTWGRIYNANTGNILPKNIDYCKDKYITESVTLRDGSHTMIQIHRIELLVFNPIPGCNNMIVHHKDNIKYHNWIWNLGWTSVVKNAIYAVRDGCIKTGENAYIAKVSNEDVKLICQMIQNGMRPIDIENIVNIPGCNVKNLIFNIIHGHSWREISRNYIFPGSHLNNNPFTQEQKIAIRNLFMEYGANIKNKDILNYLGINSNDRIYHLALDECRRMCD